MSNPEPSKISRFLLRLRHPYKYHLLRLFERDPVLEGRFYDYEHRREEVPLPNVVPLLEGTIQPSDFVRTETEVLPEKEPEKWLVLYKNFKEKQHFLSDELNFQSSLLRLEMNVTHDRYLMQIVGLLVVALVSMIALFILSLVPLPYNPFPILADSNLSFAGVLIVCPTVMLFIYGRLMRAHYNREKEIEAKITRIAGAHHVLKTLDDVYQMRYRLQAKIEEEQEQWERETIREMRKEAEQWRRKMKRERQREMMQIEFEEKRRDLDLPPRPRSTED